MLKEFHIATAFLVLILLSGAQKAPSTFKDKVRSKLVCYGEYSPLDLPPDARKDPDVQKIKTYDRWVLYRMSDGSYVVEIKWVMGLKINERHEFSPEMKTKSVQWSSEVNDPEIGTEKFTCNYGEDEIACWGDKKGQHMSAKLQQKPPYVADPGWEDLAIDHTWAWHMIIAEAARSLGQPTAITPIGIEEGDGGGIKLVPKPAIHVEYLGQEIIEVGKKKFTAHRFRLKNEPGEELEEEPHDFWLSGSGLLLKHSDKYISVGLNSFKGAGCNSLLLP